MSQREIKRRVSLAHSHHSYFLGSWDGWNYVFFHRIREWLQHEELAMLLYKGAVFAPKVFDR